MGDGIAVECPICSTKRTFLRGVGMEYSSLEKILLFAQPDHRREIERILKAHAVSTADYEHRSFLCDGCSRLSDHLYVKLLYGSDQIYDVYVGTYVGTSMK